MDEQYDPTDEQPGEWQLGFAFDQDSGDYRFAVRAGDHEIRFVMGADEAKTMAMCILGRGRNSGAG